MVNSANSSSYLGLLPAIYAEDEDFLGRFLLAFEQIFTGPADGKGPPGLEQAIAGIARLFDPLGQAGFLTSLGATRESRQEFLSWLSGWVALSLRADWSEDEQRAFLAKVAQLYRLRGTKEALNALLETYTRRSALITEGDALPQAERQLPHHFHVTIYMQATQEDLDKIGAIARGLIELQKPAHTTYVLEFKTRTLRILAKEQDDDGQWTASIGVDTTLTRFDDPS